MSYACITGEPPNLNDFSENSLRNLFLATYVVYAPDNHSENCFAIVFYND